MIPGPDGIAVVVGASGGIGGALTRRLVASGAYRRVVALSRAGLAPDLPDDTLSHGRIDLLDEATIESAAQGPIARAIQLAEAPPRLVVLATGALQGGGIGPPERSYRALDRASLLRSAEINLVGPALCAKHLLPLLPRQGRSVFAALSARVGSIGDNRLGGWHAYRCTKAALNMLLRNLAIELARTHTEAIVLGLHPGTVDTGLSRPFQGGVRPGRLFTPEVAATHLLAAIAGATPDQTGSVLAWDGSTVIP